MNNLWKLLIVLLVSAGTSAGVCLLVMAKNAPKDGESRSSAGDLLGQMESFGKVHPGRQRDVVAALGRIEPSGDLIAVGGAMGDRVQQLLVAEGDWVEPDQILAYLQSHEEIVAERELVEAKLAEARARLKAETAYADALIRQAQVAQYEAQRVGPHQVAIQDAQVRLARTNLETAREDLQRMQDVGRRDIVSSQSLDHQAALVRQAEDKLASAEAALAQAHTASEVNLSKAQAQLDAAKSQLEQVKSSVPVASLERQIVATEARLKRSVIRAPTAGRVLTIDTHAGESTGQRAILTLADTRGMYVVAEVYETDVGLVRKGQRAEITSPALPRPLSGTVERVGRMIYKNDLLHVDPAAVHDARVVETHIRLNDPEPARDLIRLQVDVRIRVGGARKTGGTGTTPGAGDSGSAESPVTANASGARAAPVESDR
jgi:HlyD family secretion protein